MHYLLLELHLVFLINLYLNYEQTSIDVFFKNTYVPLYVF